jgi:hypothetical protein
VRVAYQIEIVLSTTLFSRLVFLAIKNRHQAVSLDLGADPHRFKTEEKILDRGGGVC